MTVKYLMQRFKFRTKNWKLILCCAIDSVICLLMPWKSVNGYWLSTMQFLGMIQRLKENIQIALSFSEEKPRKKRKKKKREDKRVTEVRIRDFFFFFGWET